MLKYIVSGLLVLFTAAACGGIGTDGCNFVGKEPRCQERETKKGDPTADFKNECQANGGVWGGGCPAGEIGGCELENNDVERIVDYYYPPLTREDAMAMCTGNFVAEK